MRTIVWYYTFNEQTFEYKEVITYAEDLEVICMNKRWINDNKIMLTAVLVLVFLLATITSMQFVQADESTEYEKSFISIEIQEGDTLTSIAKEYAISEAEYADYIEEVQSINSLNSDAIQAGCYLMIPIYQECQSNLAMQN